MMAGPVEFPHGAAKMASCLALFRLGWDTQKIADYWLIPEEEAHLRVTAERCAEKKLPLLTEPSPYAAGQRYAIAPGNGMAAWRARGVA
jgi:hypothetical protein